MEKYVLEFLETLVCTIYDCIEACFDTFIIIKGKKSILVLYVCLGFLVLSIILTILKMPTFINWYEALLASVITGGILLVNNWNSQELKEIRKKILNRRK